MLRCEEEEVQQISDMAADAEEREIKLEEERKRCFLKKPLFDNQPIIHEEPINTKDKPV